jgi:hypothetical protein
MAYLEPEWVAQFAPESMAHFGPEWVAQFGPEYAPELVKSGVSGGEPVGWE